MATNFVASTTRLQLRPCRILLHKHNTHPSTSRLPDPSHLRTVSSHCGGGSVSEEEPSTSFSGSALLPSARAQLDLLDQLTSSSASPSSSITGGEWRGTNTIRDQLLQLADGREGDFSVALGKNNLKKVSARFLTVSQKRNIRRQAYLNEVEQRNDSAFFATIGAFVILPPVVILGIAIFTGYVQLFP